MNTKQKIFSVVCLFLFLAIPSSAWVLLDPETFWQRFVMAVFTLLYIPFGGMIGGFVWLWVMSEVFDEF